MTWFKRKLANFLWDTMMTSDIEVRKLRKTDTYLFLLPESTSAEEVENFREIIQRMIDGEYAIILSDKTNIIGFE